MSDTADLPSVSVHDAVQRDPSTLLLDVREPDEWAAGHAPGARHLPLAEVSADEVPADTTIYCLCRSGGRSSKATAALRAAGLDAVNVTGGMNAWAEAQLPIVRDDGSAGQVV